MSKNSGEIGAEIEALMQSYTIAISSEIKDMSDQELLRLARTNSSNWSGGYSAHNALEQIVQQLALDRMDKRLSKFLYGPRSS